MFSEFIGTFLTGKKSFFESIIREAYALQDRVLRLTGKQQHLILYPLTFIIIKSAVQLQMLCTYSNILMQVMESVM